MTTRDHANGTFIRALGLWDVVMMSVVAVVGLRWIARGARAGAPSVLLWMLAAAAFFVPLAAALAELSSRYPQQGGIYVWARRAFGPVHGFICGWCLWVNNLFYFPSLLLFGAANAPLTLGDRFAWLADTRWYSVTFVLAGLWFCAALNIVGLQRGKWLQNIGSLGTWIPAGLLIAAGTIAFVSDGSATSFAPSQLIPRDDFFATLSLWSAMCFAFSGFEISAMVGQEVKNPRRTLPLGVAIAGLATLVIYIVGSASVLVAVPASALAERSGIADAVDIVSERIGLVGLGAFTALLLALGAVAGTSSWTAGSARVPFAAGVDRVLPATFARLHPRYRTPHVALIVQAIISSMIFLVSLFFTMGGAQTSLQEAYDIMVNLTILIYFVPYLYLFLALPRLRRLDVDGRTASPDAILVPGGKVGLWGVALTGFASTAVSLFLLFIPPAGTGNVVNFEANIILQAGAIMLVGAIFYFASGRGRSAVDEDSSHGPHRS